MFSNFFNKVWRGFENFANGMGIDLEFIAIIAIYSIPIIPPLMVIMAYSLIKKRNDTYQDFREIMRKSFWMRAVYGLLLPIFIWGIIFFFKREITIEPTLIQIGLAYVWPAAFLLMYILRFSFAAKLKKKGMREKAELDALRKETTAGKDFYTDV